jgi:endonuclease G, mitochondrial
MKFLFFFLYIFLLPFFSLSQSVIPPSFVNFTKDSLGTRFISHLAYATCIDTNNNLPVYVSHAINKQIIKAGEIKRERPDNPSYPKDSLYPKLKSDAFSGSGYDHGHLAPARDFKWNEQAWNECFLMTNMSPQHGCMNQKGWCYLESLCRYWAENSTNDDIEYIVSGIVPGKYIDTLCINTNLKVFVPAQFYKVALLYNSKTKSAKGIGFIVNNADVNDQEALNTKVPIDSVEKVTGLDFFSFLDDNIEKKVESEIGFSDFTCTSECPYKDCDVIYSKRTKPTLRTKLRCF